MVATLATPSMDTPRRAHVAIHEGASVPVAVAVVARCLSPVAATPPMDWMSRAATVRRP